MSGLSGLGVAGLKVLARQSPEAHQPVLSSQSHPPLLLALRLGYHSRVARGLRPPPAGDSGWGPHGDRLERVKRGGGREATAGSEGDEVLDPCRLHTADAGGGSLGRVGLRPHCPENGDR